MVRDVRRESRSSRRRALIAIRGWCAGLLMAAAGCTSSSPSRPAESTAAPVASDEKTEAPATDSNATAKVAETPARDSDATVAVFLTALGKRDFASAAAGFDATVEAALPAEKLAAAWDSQAANLGALVSWTIAQRTQMIGKDVRVAVLQFERGQLQALVSITPETQEIAGLFFKPLTAPATPPASYVDPSAFRTEEVSLGKTPFVLKGTLTMPIGKGPFAGAVLVHGSGPNDRDESVGANKPFKDLAEGLASRGIAVLRYDKRTFQYGQQLGKSVSIDDEVVLDAIAAVKLLEARPDVDPRRVFVIGHSLGALLAPEIAVRAKTAAGVILLAPPGRKPWDAVLAQLRYLETPAEQMAEIEKTVALLQAGKLGDGTLLGAPAAYWQDWASRDGVGMARKLRKPILILRGERDYQVIDEDLATWKKGLAGVGGVELVTIPGANHLFIQGTGKPGPAEYMISGHVDQIVIDKLVSFMSGGESR